MQTRREIVVHPGAVAIIPVFSNGDVLLVRQYRHPVRSELWEIPAGKLEPGEDALSCAQRELQEETGYAANRWTRLTSFLTSPGFSNERITLFHASDLRRVGAPDVVEIDECLVLPIDDVESMIRDERIADAKTILAIGWILRQPPEKE